MSHPKTITVLYNYTNMSHPRQVLYSVIHDQYCVTPELFAVMTDYLNVIIIVGDHHHLTTTFYIKHFKQAVQQMYVCMYVWSSHTARVRINRVRFGCQSCSLSAEQEKCIFPCPRSRLRIWSRGTVSAVPSRVSLLISALRLNLVLTCGEFSRIPRWRPSVYLNRHTSSGQSRVHRVTQLRTDGVHCRESAGMGQ